MFKVGIVNKYFDKVGTAIVTLDNNLSIGDRVRFIFNDEDLFDQTVETIKIDYKKVDSANRGNVIVLKTNEMVKTGTEIFKIS